MIRNFGWIEAILLGLFLIAYGIYLWRIIRISRALHSPAYTIIFKLVLRSVAVGLIIVSILGPSFGDSKKEIKSVGKDIMLCVDLSKSMDAFDIQPTRLEKIKFELNTNKLNKNFPFELFAALNLNIPSKNYVVNTNFGNIDYGNKLFTDLALGVRFSLWNN